MGESTGISWTHATLNFWVGCTKVSTGDLGACEFCYAEAWARRWPAYRDTWGTGAPRFQFKHTRSKALKLERMAVASGEPFYCFSNSLSDIFDKEVPIKWLADAFDDMRAAPHVTFLLLTKRAPNILKRVEAAGGLPANAALGITAVTQEEADRDIPHLLRAKAVLKPAFAFLSMEPLMGPVDLTKIVLRRDGRHPTELSQRLGDYVLPLTGAYTDSPRLNWIITGGESGHQARPSHPDWFRSLRDQCAAAEVPFHMKQWGEWIDHDQPGVDMLGTAKSPLHFWTKSRASVRIGKKAAGRLLDGLLHDAMPEVSRG